MVEEHFKYTKRRYNINEVANILGIYKGTIKNYEEKGIFPKPRRNPINKYREYSPEDIVEMAEKNLVESLLGASNVGRARDFFSSSRMTENISSFQEMDNYNELLQIAQNLLSRAQPFEGQLPKGPSCRSLLL